MYVWMYVCMYACMHAWMDGCMFVCMYIHRKFLVLHNNDGVLPNTSSFPSCIPSSKMSSESTIKITEKHFGSSKINPTFKKKQDGAPVQNR